MARALRPPRRQDLRRRRRLRRSGETAACSCRGGRRIGEQRDACAQSEPCTETGRPVRFRSSGTDGRCRTAPGRRFRRDVRRLRVRRSHLIGTARSDTPEGGRPTHSSSGSDAATGFARTPASGLASAAHRRGRLERPFTGAGPIRTGAFRGSGRVAFGAPRRLGVTVDWRASPSLTVVGAGAVAGGASHLAVQGSDRRCMGPRDASECDRFRRPEWRAEPPTACRNRCRNGTPARRNRGARGDAAGAPP